MRCDGSPDPTIQGEINTYINLKLETKDRDDAESVLKDSQLDLAVSFCGFLPLTYMEDVNLCNHQHESIWPLFVVKMLTL